jgi:hypothetical protein
VAPPPPVSLPPLEKSSDPLDLSGRCQFQSLANGSFGVTERRSLIIVPDPLGIASAVRVSGVNAGRRLHDSQARWGRYSVPPDASRTFAGATSEATSALGALPMRVPEGSAPRDSLSPGPNPSCNALASSVCCTGDGAPPTPVGSIRDGGNARKAAATTAPAMTRIQTRRLRFMGTLTTTEERQPMLQWAPDPAQHPPERQSRPRTAVRPSSCIDKASTTDRTRVSFQSRIQTADHESAALSSAAHWPERARVDCSGIGVGLQVGSESTSTAIRV